MFDNSFKSKAWQPALVAYCLFAAGCHGWMPTMMQPVLLMILGSALIVLAGPGRLPGALGCLRFVPLLVSLWARQKFAVDLLATAGVLASLCLVAAPKENERDDRFSIGSALLVVALVQVILSTSTGFHLEEVLTGWVNALASMFAGHVVDLGPVFGGVRAMLLSTFLLASLASAGWRRLAVMVTVQFALAVILSIVVEALAAQITFGSKGAGHGLDTILSTQIAWLPFAVAVLAMPIVLRFAQQPGSANAAGNWRLLAPVVAIAASVFVMLSLPPAALRNVEHVVFYRPGFSNWEVADPELGNAGPYSTGMMGTLLPFARSLGATADLVDEIDDEVLTECDVLVFVNQDEPLGEAVQARVATWVAAGGHVMVVGDHTFLQPNKATGGFDAFINEPLAASGISFPNNSGDHLTVAFRDATVTAGLARRLDCVEGNPYSPIIGSALEVHWPARPIVIGRFGYSDAGIVPTQEDDQTLGDLTWNRGERLGGIVLLAEQQIGSGRVTAVGDTTGFHNIARTHTWQAVGQLMLGQGRDAHGWYWSLFAAGLAAFAVMSLRGKTPAPVVTVSLMAAAAAFGNADVHSMPLRNPDEPLMIFEMATGPDGRAGDWTPEGHLTQISNAARSDLLPIIMDTAKHGIPAGAKVIMISRPRVDPGDAWREAVLDFVHDGGHLIIASAFATDNPIDGLLQQIGCTIEPNVIGPQSVRIDDAEGSLTIRMSETWNLRLVEGEWRRIVYGEDTISMAARTFGKGRITMTTDQTFLQNRHQENEDTLHLDNMRFTMSLLRTGWTR